MLFCYIDESGTPQVPGNTSHYVLAGLSIPVDKWKTCENEVQKIKRKYRLDDAEIHTGWLLWPILEQNKIPGFYLLDYPSRKYEVEKYRKTELLRLQSPQTKQLYHKTKKNYRQTQDYTHLTFDERKAFVLEIATLIGSWEYCRLFAECIDKIHFNPSVTRNTVDEQAFEQIVSRFEQYLKIYSKTKKKKQFGLLIHDNNEAVSNKHTSMMKKFHRAGTVWTSVENIIETPLFVDSHLTSMVQLADVCGYSIRRYLEKKEDHLFNEIFKIFDRKNGKIVGVRHFTSSSCTCLICSGHR